MNYHFDIFWNRIGLGLVLCVVTATMACGQDLTGIEKLRQELGSMSPAGRNVTVTQVEASAMTGYCPVDTGGQTVLQGTGLMLGKSMTLLSGASGASGHAATVASVLFGPAGTAPSVSQTYHFSAARWMSVGSLRPSVNGLVAEPQAELGQIVNHSWIGGGPSNNQNDSVRRADYAAERDGMICVVGSSNGASGNVPQLMTSMYNGISVGLVNGNHGAGSVPSLTDGVGRQKPDLVAPGTATSYSTPIVSGIAAQLIETTHRLNLPASSRRPEVIKSILLAGATAQGLARPLIHTATKPLDPVFGAGVVNAYESHHIIDPTGDETSSSGWAADITDRLDVEIVVPANRTALVLKAALCWHRTLSDDPATAGFNPLPNPMTNLQLQILNSASQLLISESNSAVDNVELLSLVDLPAGSYTLRVMGTQAARLGLAWRTELSDPIPPVTPSIPAQLPQIDFVLTPDGQPCGLAVSHLIPQTTYEIQCTTDLSHWSTLTTLQPQGAEINCPLSVTASMPRCYFRLVAATRDE